jgi:hypothetical protein
MQQIKAQMAKEMRDQSAAYSAAVANEQGMAKSAHVEKASRRLLEQALQNLEHGGYAKSQLTALSTDATSLSEPLSAQLPDCTLTELTLGQARLFAYQSTVAWQMTTVRVKKRWYNSLNHP